MLTMKAYGGMSFSSIHSFLTSEITEMSGHLHAPRNVPPPVPFDYEALQPSKAAVLEKSLISLPGIEQYTCEIRLEFFDGPVCFTKGLK
jgi:hypothetical protein